VADDLKGLLLLWKFVPFDDSAGNVRWRWEAWAQSGRLVARSLDSFDMLTDCERDAIAAGYLPPAKRL
jgi:hypothetical protein